MDIVNVYEEEAKRVSSKVRTETMGIDIRYENLGFCAVTNNKHLLIDGRRLQRGLYQTKSGRLINTDQNAALI